MKKFWKRLKEKITSKGISASDVYSIVKYGAILDSDGIKNKLIKDIEVNIQNRIAHNVFSTVIDLDTDNIELIAYVKDYYTAKGFSCIVIDSRMNTAIESPKLYIGWKYVTI